jgi:energy-coupling factor transporter ATP-binding protein EcfA2
MYRLQNISYVYPREKKPSLMDLSLAVEEGEFVLICGPSGGGKSTLARLMGGFIPSFFGGQISGDIYFKGKTISQWEENVLRSSIGMVFQYPERQLVMNNVRNEIVFSMENLGVPSELMQQRLAEISSLLNCVHLLDYNTHELSGGEQQKVVIASTLASANEVLILDEPTAQLDPQATEILFDILRHLHQELGLTIILIEQNLETCFSIADRIVLIDDGKLVTHSNAKLFSSMVKQKHRVYMPLVTRFFKEKEHPSPPLSLVEGRKMLKYAEWNTSFTKSIKHQSRQDAMLEVKSIHYAYPNGKEAIKDVSFSIRKGQLYCVLGENGAGKSSLLRAVLGDIRPQKGAVSLMGRSVLDVSWDDRIKLLGYLSQHPSDYLINETVYQELLFTLTNRGAVDKDRIEELLNVLDLQHLRDRHPRQLSIGERQRVALGSVLVANPCLLLVDEPTRGLDPVHKKRLGQLFRSIIRENRSILLVTQDIDFAADVADNVILMFQGELIANGNPRDILTEGLYYMTIMARLFRNKRDHILTYQDACLSVNGFNDVSC